MKTLKILATIATVILASIAGYLVQAWIWAKISGILAKIF